MAHYFTSDWHLGDQNILSYERRPFSCAEEMDEAIIQATCRRMTVKDDLWILGDFMRGADLSRARHILNRIPGRKHLIAGNHDRQSIISLAEWHSTSEKVELKADGQPLTLCHYPLAAWNGSHIEHEGIANSIMLFGHVHSRTRGWWRCVNVGVEHWNYAPASLTEVLARSEENRIAVPFHVQDFPDRVAADARAQMLGVTYRADRHES